MSSSKRKSGALNARLTPRLEARVDLLRRAQETTKSNFLRRALERECSVWLDSPYVAENTTHFLWVAQNGDFHYCRDDKLRLNQYLQSIPASISMKHAKITSYLSDCDDGGHPADYIRSKWKDVEFSLSDEFVLLDRGEDHHGITLKRVDLDCLRPEGRVVSRTSRALISDYVQWHVEGREDRQFDSLETDVEVPTLSFEVCVVLDYRIYESTPRSTLPPLNRGSLKLKMQNMEGVHFEGTVEGNTWTKMSNWWPRDPRQVDEEYSESLARVTSLAERFVPEGCRSTSKECLFYYAKTDNLLPGVRVSIEWPRPARARSIASTESFDS